MDWFFGVLGALVVIGAALAIWERRRKRVLLAHDLNLAGPQTDADREAIRAADQVHTHTHLPPH